MSELKLDNCELQWDRARGVLYVHNKENGCTVLRIQGLPVPTLETATLAAGKMIDVQVKGNASVPIF